MHQPFLKWYHFILSHVSSKVKLSRKESLEKEAVVRVSLDTREQNCSVIAGLMQVEIGAITSPAQPGYSGPVHGKVIARGGRWDLLRRLQSYRKISRCAIALHTTVIPSPSASPTCCPEFRTHVQASCWPFIDCLLYDVLPFSDIEFRVSTLPSYFILFWRRTYPCHFQAFSGTLVLKRSPEVIDMV